MNGILLWLMLQSLMGLLYITSNQFGFSSVILQSAHNLWTSGPHHDLTALKYAGTMRWYVTLKSKMWRHHGHFLIWIVLLARWMTLLLDCDTITTNQWLEQYQTVNQLLKRIGSRDWGPTNHIFGKCVPSVSLSCILLPFPFTISLLCCWHLFFIPHFHQHPHCVYLSFAGNKKKYLWRERDRRGDMRTNTGLSFGWPPEIPAQKFKDTMGLL